MQYRTSSFLRLLIAASTAFLVASTAHALEAPVGATQSASATQGTGEAVAVNITAKVTKVFTETSSVEVQGPKGNKVVIDVDPAIADVRKLKVGDDVHMAYRAAVLLSADKVDPKGVQSRVTAHEAHPASGGVVVKTAAVQVVAVIEHIDAQNREVTLSGPKRTVTVQVQPDVSLDKLKVGDSVLATYLAATAVDVTRDGQLVK